MRNRFWLRVGVAVAIASVPALFAVSFLSLTEDSALLADPEPIDSSSSDVLNWDWYEHERECEYFVSCAFIEVENTARCPDQIFIPMFVSDDQQNRVTWSDLILDSPGLRGTAVVEVGVNIEDFSYFNVGEITCTVGPPTLEMNV